MALIFTPARPALIGGGKPGMKVSWLAIGERQDKQTTSKPLQVEIDRAALWPALYGGAAQP